MERYSFPSNSIADRCKRSLGLCLLILIHFFTQINANKLDEIHRYMSKRDLSNVFGVESHDQVPPYEIIYPTFYNKIHEHKTRVKRDGSFPKDFFQDHPASFDFAFSAFGMNLHFNLTLNKDLVSPNFKMEVVGSNGTVTYKKNTDKLKSCHYKGNMTGQSKSRAAVSNCDGLRGIVTTDSKEHYFIEPIPKHLSNDTAKSGDKMAHILFKRSGHDRLRRSLGQNPLDLFMGITNSNQKTSTCGTKHNPKLRLTRDIEAASEPESTDKRERYIETLVVVDREMCNYHGEDAATQFTMTILNMAAILLIDDSIGASLINLVIVKLQLLTINPPGLLINHHVENTLNQFGDWASKQSDPDDRSDDHYDYAILLTRYNICADKSQPCDYLGATFVSGMCQWPYSVSVNEDNGLPLAFTITHQIGHSLGMNHDGEESSFVCPDGMYIMAKTSPSAHKTSSSWSRCSRNYLRQFFSKEQAKCLLDVPSKTKRVDLGKFDSKGGLLYDADKQCQMMFGMDSRLCPAQIAKMCLELWCTDPNKSPTCLQSKNPAADGTTCGKNRWCMRGDCIKAGATRAIDGSWSSWQDSYSACSRSCGGGVQYKERICNNPKPHLGGKHCDGEPRQYRLCNTKPCQGNVRNTRAGQCERLSNRLFGEKYFEWEFKPSRIAACKLGCFIKDTQHGYDFGNADDGTNCDQLDESVLADKCINGQCITVGCDGLIGSDAKFDRCGVCNGDGTTCQGGNGHMTGADNDGIADALKSLKEMGFDMGSLYGKSELSLSTRGRIPHTPDSAMAEFIWARIKSGCSVSCGGGVEVVHAECRRQDDGSPAPDKRCDPLLKPPTQSFPCKQELCPPTWQTSYWGDCSKTCNEGIKHRDVRCVQKSGQGVEYEVDETMCLGAKPKHQEACNREPCPPEWISQPFGECSTICGPGIQVREVLCQRTSADGSVMTLKSEACDQDSRPPTEQRCNVHNPCPGDGNCGGIYTEERGNLSSPNFPNNYPNNMECIHIIQVPEGRIIQLYFDTMKIVAPKDFDCRTDFVKVMDGDCVSRLGESKYCGRGQPPPFISTTNRLCIKFFSDDSQNDQGFSATYDSTDAPTQPADLCGSNITAPAGLVASPNYPEFYPSNEECNMTIVTADRPLRLTFHAFDVGSEDCSNDFVFISGGDETKKYCGQKVPPIYMSKHNWIFIRFVSTNHAGNTKPGFVATYTSGGGTSEIKSLATPNPETVANLAPKQVDGPKLNDTSSVLTERSEIPNMDGYPVPKPYVRPFIKPLPAIETPSPQGAMVTSPVNNNGNPVTFVTVAGKDSEIAKEVDLTKKMKSQHSLNDGTSKGKTTSQQPLWIPEPATESNEMKSEIVAAPKAIVTKSAIRAPPKMQPVKERLRPILKSLQNEKRTFKSILSSKREEIIDNLDGKRGQCPSPSVLTCIRVLLSYPCKTDLDCQQYGAMSCCKTSCEYGNQICIPKVTKSCPLRDPYYFPYIKCSAPSDCPGKAACCLDMTGRKYCRPPRYLDLIMDAAKQSIRT